MTSMADLSQWMDDLSVDGWLSMANGWLFTIDGMSITTVWHCHITVGWWGSCLALWTQQPLLVHWHRTTKILSTSVVVKNTKLSTAVVDSFLMNFSFSVSICLPLSLSLSLSVCPPPHTWSTHTHTCTHMPTHTHTHGKCKLRTLVEVHGPRCEFLTHLWEKSACCASGGECTVTGPGSSPACTTCLNCSFTGHMPFN